MLKKTFILFTSIIFVTISFITPVFAKTFSDVDENTDYYGAIQWMGNEGVVEGYEDGTFGPDICVNRVEFIKMLYETLGINENRYFGKLFPDTYQGDWYEQYVLAARTKNTIEGYEDGFFRPANCVNRVEAIKMAMKEFYGNEIPEISSIYNNEYSDIDKDSWYFDFFDYAYSANLLGLNHVSEDLFAPGDAMNRKEVMELLYRMKAVTDNDLIEYEEGTSPISAGYVPGEFRDINVEQLGISFSYPEEWGELKIESFDCSVSLISLDNGDDAIYKYRFLSILNPVCYARGGGWEDIFRNIEDIEPANYCTEFGDDPNNCGLFTTNNGYQGIRFSDYDTELYRPAEEPRKFKTNLYIFDHPWEWKYMVGIHDYGFMNRNDSPYYEEQLLEVARSLEFTEQPEFMKEKEMIEITSLELVTPDEQDDRYIVDAEGVIDSSCEVIASFEFTHEDNTIDFTFSKRQINENCSGVENDIVWPANGDLSDYIDIENLEPGEYTVTLNDMIAGSFTI